MTCPSCESGTDASWYSCPRCGEPLPISPGRVIAERYEVQAQLGEGGMGTVFRARDRALHVNVALKVLRLGGNPAAVRRFHHEVNLARKVKHENVCAIYEYGQDKGIVYCTMELVGGANLHQTLRAGALPVDQAYEIALKAAAGLQAIHEAGVLHRDLKAHNIMIDGRKRVRLVDFGIARAMPAADVEGTPAESTPSSITEHNSVVGTPEYMSPEQVMGWPLDQRSDIYSFAIVLFELFTGQLPFRGTSRAATMRKHLEEPPPFGGPLAQLLPTRLVPILERALAKDPDRRHADVKELARDLEQARASFKTETVEVLAGDALPRWAMPALVLLVAGLALLAWSRLPSLPGGGPQASPATTTAPPATTLVTVPTTFPAASPKRTPRAGALGPSLATPDTTPVTTPPTPPPTTVPATTPVTLPITTTSTILLTPPTTVPPRPVEKPAECLSCPRPSYPPAAAIYGLEGDVEVEIVVDEQGRVTLARALSGHSALRDAARKAVLAWRFAPATRDGVPVASTRRIPVQFRLAAKTPP